MLTEHQFSEISSLLKHETAVVLDIGKEYLIETRLASLARERGFRSVAELVDRVLGRTDPELNKKALLALTTNETSFFRDFAPFELLKTKLLPQIVENRTRPRSLKIWSAACSTGQEPYSLAILIRDTFPQLLDWRFQILASDIHSDVLRKARTGEYSSFEVNRGLPVKYLVTYFDQVGDSFAIKPEIKSQVEFFEQNLIGSWDVSHIDIIFLRNVMIYFDTPTKKGILEKVKNVLAPGGYLFLGTAESPYRLVEGFEKVEGAPNVYKLRAGNNIPKAS